MKAFRALSLAAAMGLMVAFAFPQGRGHDDRDKGGQSSGGSSHNAGGSSGGTSTGGSSSGGSHDRGTGGSSGGGYSGGSSSGGSGRGGSSGGGYSGGGSGYSGGGHLGGGDSSSGNWHFQGRGGDTGRGNGSGTSGGSSGGSSGSGQKGDGDLGRGHGGATGGGGSNSGGGSSSGGNRGGSNNGGGGTVGGGDTGGTWGGSGSIDRSRGGGNSRDGDPITISGGNGRGSGWEDRLGRKDSHSGTSHYNGSNNVSSVTRVGGSIIIGRPPIDLRNLGKDNLIRRKDHPVLISSGVRVGYYFYTPLWCDDYFWYPWYQFDPWGDRCCVSPWYYYPCLPPYIAWDRCRFYNLSPWNSWYGEPYAWQRPYYYGNYDTWGRGRASEIDYAVDDIVNAFERADRRAVGRLVSSNSEVAIYVDGKYSYTLNANDFYDMFLDATQNVKTTRYAILRVETGHDEGGHDIVRVTARHEYEDPWGAVTSVNHFYELRYPGRNLVITKFGLRGTEIPPYR